MTAQYRPVRQVVWTVYFVIVLAFCGSLVVGTYRSARAMTPGVSRMTDALLGVDECELGLDAFATEIEAARADMASPLAERAHARFIAFREDWLIRERRLEAMCALGDAARASLRTQFEALNTVLEVSNASSVQFSRDVGPALDIFRKARAQP